MGNKFAKRNFVKQKRRNYDTKKEYTTDAVHLKLQRQIGNIRLYFIRFS
jgi:hypothetical protein